MSRFSHLPAPRESPPLQGVKTPHPSGVDKPLLLVPSQQPKPSLPHTVEKDGSSSSWEDHSESENSSEGEAPQPQPTATPAPAKPAPPPPQDSDSESSNSSSDVENTTASSHQPQPESQPSLFPPADVSNYSDKDLEALIRGPGVPLKFTELPSSESSEDEEPDGVQLDNESEQEPVSQTRKAPRFYAPSKDSSDEGEDENDDNEDSDTFHTLSAYTSAPPPVARAGPIEDGGKSHPIPEPSQDNKSFQQMGGRQSSVESDQGGNKAFEEALAQENVVLELAREPTSLPSAEESSRPAIVTQHSTDNSAVTNEPSKTDTDQEEGPGEAEFNNTDLGKGTIPEDIVEKEPELTQTLEPGHVEVLETLGDHVTGIPALLGLTEADGEVPSTPLPPPPEQPREEPTRASTPKPGILERMRSRVGLTLPVKNQPSRSSIIMTPVAKASSTRAATLRSQQKPKTRSQSTGSSHEENDADAGAITPGPVAGKPASRRGAVPASVSKSAPTRSKAAAEKNLERVQEDQEVPNPLPRRSTRTASKTPGTSTPMPPPPLKRARQARPPLVAEENRDSSQLRRRKVSQQKKGAPKATVKSPTPPPTTEDDNVEASSSQSVQPQEDVTLPPSPPVSLDTWETLQTETPVDPIPFSLKPQYQRKTPTFGRNKPISRFEQAVHDADHPEKGKGKTKNTPLFMPSDSQTTFPHSQFQTPAAALVATDSSDSEAEVRNSVIKNRAPSQSQPPQYRKLTEIASQASSLFTPKVLRQSTTLSRAAASVPAKRKDRLDQMYGRMGKKSEVEESSNESSQSSDSETEKVSHIPKSRKAGAGSKRRMSLA
ncbi:hypothetical protein P691DRAFT_287067 [Macrolepiota fuliginosa MF-IS2]|uniref:Uncharacterized protein n=1 Tax=Macrolepiota fuliginosa MF-IS2 TaxID=1400762 RepID=A0A9P5XLM6_9AGAR|nr:hypothetical protein P691DRAFT_287067 [Macrolepiota fuliginosa MF-IS2]